ncbi:MAG TPA: NERD domain-containing protein [Rhodothermales bacterium]
MGEELTAQARICPRCGSPMVVRTAGRGSYEGHQFCGCSTFPKCRAVIGIKAEVADEVLESSDSPASPAGASAQAEYERAKEKNRQRIRRQWPYAVGVSVIVIVVVYLVVQSFSDARWGAAAAAGVGLVLLVGFVNSPKVAAWREGAEGERRTARHLDGLADAGFIVFHDRRVPGYGGNLDHVAIGPTGVWAIETKSWTGKVEIDGSQLMVRGHPRDKAVDQVFREATAVQIALGEALSRLGVTVTPVLCLHRARMPFFAKAVQGVRIASGKQLVGILRTGEARLTPEQVQALAREAEQILKPALRRAA